MSTLAVLLHIVDTALVVFEISARRLGLWIRRIGLGPATTSRAVARAASTSPHSVQSRFVSLDLPAFAPIRP